MPEESAGVARCGTVISAVLHYQERWLLIWRKSENLDD
jgi:hypothetical protein